MGETKLVGIVNVTPDSFSDGGANFDAGFAIQTIERLIEEGADIIDIGAESTRPGATLITPEEEWQRLSPVLAALPRFFSQVQFSVDTRHAATAKKALDAGAHWINDVTGFSDAAMVDAVRKSNCTLVMMHSLGVPADKKNILPESADVAQVLLEFAEARIVKLEKEGIAKERIIFDPGIGFGKNARQSLTILREIERFKTLAVPLLIGHSRKSFLSSLPLRGRVRVGAQDGKAEQECPPPNLPPTGGENADEATLVISQYLAKKNIDYLRVHNVARHRQMLGVMKALYD